MGNNKSPPALNDLLDWFERALTDCADFIETKPHAFLWSARRCAEALCVTLASIENHRQDKLDDQSLDALTRYVPKKHLGSVKSLQIAGNYAAHVQPAERFDLRLLHQKSDEVRASLIVLTEWFYGEALKRSLPERVTRDLERIRSAARAMTSTPPAVAEAPRGSSWRIAGVALLGVLGGAVLASLLWILMATSAAPSQPGANEQSAPSARVTRPRVTASLTAPIRDALDGGSMVATDASPTQRMPARSGTVLVTGGEVVVGQPGRGTPNWGAPIHPGVSPRAMVADFELDVTPVSLGDYEAAAATDLSLALNWSGCVTSHPAMNEPVVCVTWTQAVKYCELHHGRLPGVAEWERAAERHVATTVPNGDWFEWVADVSPAGVFDRGPARPCNDERGAAHARCHHSRSNLRNASAPPRYNWNITYEERRTHNQGFRCAFSR